MCHQFNTFPTIFWNTVRATDTTNVCTSVFPKLNNWALPNPQKLMLKKVFLYSPIQEEKSINEWR